MLGELEWQGWGLFCRRAALNVGFLLSGLILSWSFIAGLNVDSCLPPTHPLHISCPVSRGWWHHPRYHGYRFHVGVQQQLWQEIVLLNVFSRGSLSSQEKTRGNPGVNFGGLYRCYGLQGNYSSCIIHDWCHPWFSETRCSPYCIRSGVCSLLLTSPSEVTPCKIGKHWYEPDCNIKKSISLQLSSNCAWIFCSRMTLIIQAPCMNSVFTRINTHTRHHKCTNFLFSQN